MHDTRYRWCRKPTDLAFLEVLVDGGLKKAWLDLVKGGVSGDDDRVMAFYLSAVSETTVTVAVWQRYRRERGWKMHPKEAWGRVHGARVGERLWSGMTQ